MRAKSSTLQVQVAEIVANFLTKHKFANVHVHVAVLSRLFRGGENESNADTITSGLCLHGSWAIVP